MADDTSWLKKLTAGSIPSQEPVTASISKESSWLSRLTGSSEESSKPPAPGPSEPPTAEVPVELPSAPAAESTWLSRLTGGSSAGPSTASSAGPSLGLPTEAPKQSPHFVVPYVTPEWWGNFWTNIKRPVEQEVTSIKESWSDPYWYNRVFGVPYHAAMTVLKPVADLIPAQLFATAGYTGSSSFGELARENYQQPGSYRNLHDWGLFGAGLAADIASDPLTYLTAGGKPLFNVAKNIIEKQTSVPLIKAGEFVGELTRRGRGAAEVTEQAIREKAVPTMLGETFQRHLPKFESAQTPEALKAFGEHIGENQKLMPLLQGAGRLEKTAELGGKSFEDLVAAHRVRSLKELEPHLQFPETLKTPNAARPLLEKADELAAHTAALEKHAWAGRPMLRFGFGKATLETGIPNPWVAGAKAVRPLFGTMRAPQYIGASLDKAEEVAPGISQRFHDFSTSRFPGAPSDPKLSSAYDYENMMNTAMVGPYAARQKLPKSLGVKETRTKDIPHVSAQESQRLITDPTAVKRVVIREVLGTHIAPQDRLTELLAWENRYRDLAKVAEADVVNKRPTGFLSRRPEEYTKAADAIAELTNNAKLRLKLPKLSPGGKDALQHALTNDTQESIRLVQMLMKETASGFTQNPLQKSTTPEVLDAFSRIVQESHKVVTENHAPTNPKFLGKTAEDLLHRIWYNMDQLTAINTPLSHAKEYNQALLNSWKTSNELREPLISLQHTLNTFLDPGGEVSAPMHDLWSLVKSMQTEGGRELWLKTMTDLKMEAGPRVLNPKEARLARQGLIDFVTTQKGGGQFSNLSPYEYDQTLNALTQVKDEHLGPLIKSMAELSALRRVVATTGAVVHHATEPYSQALQRAEASVGKMYERDLNNLLSDLGRHQAQYDLHEYVRSGKMMKFFNMVDALKEKALSQQGFAPGFSRLLQDLNGVTQGIPNEALNWTETDVGPKLHAIFETHAGRPLSAAENAEARKGIGMVMASNWERQRISHPNPEWRIASHLESQRQYTEGMTHLRNVFGDAKFPLASSDAKVAALVKDSENFLLPLMKEMNEIEAAHGAGYWAPDRFPIIDQMSRADREAVDRSYTSHEYFNTMVAKRKSGQNIWADHYFSGPGEREAWIKMHNAGPRPQVKYEMVHDVLALLTLRRERFLRAMATNQYNARLQAMLPQSARFALNPKLFPQGAPNGWEQITRLGERFARLEDAKHWYVPSILASYLRNTRPTYSSADSVLDFYTKVSQAMFRMAVSLNMVHLKNIGALVWAATFSPGHPSVFGPAKEYMKYVWENPTKVINKSRLTPMEGFRHALDNHPDWIEGVKDGIYHFDVESGRPGWARFLERSGAVQKPLTDYVERMHGPFSTFIFDMIDRPLRLGYYKAFKKMGLPGREAANLSNLYMVDYSARFLSPTARKYGHVLFSFFGWRLGNAILHAPNMLSNPMGYALEEHIRNYMNDSVATENGMDRDHWTKALFYSYATPHTDPNGYYTFIIPGLPWKPYSDAYHRYWNNPMTAPLSMPIDVMAQMSNWIRWYTWARIFQDPRRKSRLMESPLQSIFGDEHNKGLLEESLWGVRPWERMVEGFAQGWQTGDWSGMVTNVATAAAGSIVPNEPVGYYKGKIRTIPEGGAPGKISSWLQRLTSGESGNQ